MTLWKSLLIQKVRFLIFVCCVQYPLQNHTQPVVTFVSRLYIQHVVDAVWICSPSSFHAEQIKACAANNKHVFCEKPIATELTETVEAINACNAAGVKLMIGLQRRFDQNFMRVRQAVQKKEVGEPIMIKLCSRDPSPPPFSYVKVTFM